MTVHDQIKAAVEADPRSISKISRDADMPVQTLYAVLAGGNSTISTIQALAEALGYELTFVRKEQVS